MNSVYIYSNLKLQPDDIFMLKSSLTEDPDMKPTEMKAQNLQRTETEHRHMVFMYPKYKHKKRRKKQQNI